MRDLYQILGVSRQADAATIKKAYRSRAHRDHPDKNPGDAAAEERFKEASVAYDVLSDPAKRQRYDRMGEAGLSGGGGMGGSGNVGDMFSEIFGDFFGGRRAPQRGRDRVQTLQVDFRTAIVGGEMPIEVMRDEPCGTCNGSGSRSGKAPVTCATCGGSGETKAQQGMFAVNRRCVACQGSGKVTADPCSTCRGSAKVRRPTQVRVRIPAGASDQAVLRLAGAGEPAPPGGSPGDLRLSLAITPHPLLSRQGHDLRCEAWLSLAEAATGAQVEVPTLAAPLRMKVPAGAQPGQIFRLRGQGAPAAGGRPASDLLVTVQIEAPHDSQPAELWAQLAAQERDVAYPRRSRWRTQVKTAAAQSSR